MAASGTSTTAAATEPKSSPVEDPLVTPLRRLQVHERRPQNILTAYQLEDDQTISLVSGHHVSGHRGDWVLTRNNAVLDVLPEGRFTQQYVPVDDSAMILTGPDRSALEKVLGFGSTRDSQTLTRAVINLAGLKIGQLVIDFTPQQWAELAHRAQKMRLSVEELVKHLHRKFTQDIWTI